MKYLVSPNLTI